MNKFSKAITLMRLSAAVVGTLTLMSLIASASADPIRVEMTLPGQRTIMQGEPLVLHYTIVNDSAQQMDMEMGQDGALGGTEWLTRSLKSATGGAVPALADPRHVDRGGLHFNSLWIGPNEQREGDLVASQWFAFPHPGRYTLSIRVRLPYGTGPSVETSMNESLTAATVFVQDYYFPLTVKAADPKRLQALAASLEKAVVQSKDSHQQVLLLKELVSMPEEQAWASWAEIGKHKILQGELASELVRVPSERTADILAQILWPSDTSPGAGSVSSASDSLADIYNGSNGPLKKHIWQLYAGHGIELPDQILTLQNG